jgi:hypothetical protein
VGIARSYSIRAAVGPVVGFAREPLEDGFEIATEGQQNRHEGAERLQVESQIRRAIQQGHSNVLRIKACAKANEVAQGESIA